METSQPWHAPECAFSSSPLPLDSQWPSSKVLIPVQSTVRRVSAQCRVPVRWLWIVVLLWKGVTLFDADRRDVGVGARGWRTDGAFRPLLNFSQSTASTRWEGTVGRRVSSRCEGVDGGHVFVKVYWWWWAAVQGGVRPLFFLPVLSQ
jgi:hypothetical protein